MCDTPSAVQYRITLLAISTAFLAGCPESGVLRTDGAPRSDAAVPVDGITYPDTRPAETFALLFTDPEHGPYTGGTEMLVRGVGFDDSTQVLVGGRAVEPRDLEIIDSRRIQVRTPPGEPGLADVQVERADGLSATLPAGFTYEAITVDPPTGAVAGGTFITINGFGTDFGPSTSVTIDGVEITGMSVVNEQALTGYTPPGVSGTADVRVFTPSGVFEARRAFTYQATGDPFSGGMSGGPIAGTVNVVVVDGNTKNGIDGAYVVIGDPATSPYQGFADDLGQITFSDPGLRGPITVTAAAATYETTAFVSYDAQNITIFLRKPPEPAEGPIPPGPQVGHIYGHVLFGDATSIGSPHWNLVPEPRTATEIKRIYVATTASTPFATPFSPTHPIDYQYNPAVVAWEYDVFLRPRATAVVAIAGLYDPARDPSGTGVTGFQPFAMGVARGVLVGPGETKLGVDIVVNIPLDTAVRVDLDAPPDLDKPEWPGPSYYKIRPFVDLGGEGVIHMPKNGLPTPPEPEERPNNYRFGDGETSIVLGGLAPLSGNLADASYGFIVGAYTELDTNPFSVRVARGISDVALPVTIGDFLGTPRPSDPAPDGIASGMAMDFYSEGAPTGTPSFHLHMLVNGNGDQLLRVFSRGDIFRTKIPDLTYGGLPPFPTGEDINWTMWRITVAGATFDQFTFRHLSSLYWDAYTADAIWAQFPPL